VHNFEHEKLLINKCGTKFEQKCNVSLDQYNICTYTAAIQWPKYTFHLGWNNTLWPFSCISKMMVQKNTKERLLLTYCVTLSYIPFTFPQHSKCFLSNGTKNMHSLASGPELQAVRFQYAILGETWMGGSLYNITKYVWQVDYRVMECFALCDRFCGFWHSYVGVITTHKKIQYISQQV
jgi:hypothetical protein